MCADHTRLWRRAESGQHRAVRPLVVLLRFGGLLLWAVSAAACASDGKPEGPPPAEVCADEAGELGAYVARVAGSRGTWAWPLTGAVVVREGSSFPDGDGAGHVGVEVGRAGVVSASVDPPTLDAALAAAGDARLALAFGGDVPLGRVREVLAAARAAGARELDLVFEQYKPTGPPHASGARPLIDRLDDCDDCDALKTQIRVRVSGGCLPLSDALWTDTVPAAAPFDERVAAARAWTRRLTEGMQECTCENVDVDALWDLAWQRLKEPRPMTAVPLRFAEEPARKRRKRGADEPARVRTIALDDDVPWRDAHVAFAEAAPYAVRLAP